MLYDELIADTVLGQSYTGFEHIQQTIAVADKFVLEEDFALAADGLVENFAELERIAPFCRIPYPILWIELAHMHRAHWRDAPTHYPEFQGKPKRIGFLLQADDDTLTKWKTHLCWSLQGEIPPSVFTPEGSFDFENTRLNCSVITVDYDISEKRSGLEEYVHIEPQPFFIELLERSGASLQEQMDVAGIAAPIFRSDWAGEIRYLFAVLGLLNARNATETVRPDFCKLNKLRKKNNKPPFEHKLLKIRAMHRPSLVPTKNSQQRAGEIRAHFVRGHFKTRRSGIFWWGPHVRGNRERGFVEKEYAVAV